MKNSNVNYSRVVEDSQFFTELEQILNYLKIKKIDKYLEIGIENTIKMGYKLIKEEKI